MAYSIVVIGVSLGGLDALRTLLGGLAADFPLPIAVVQHRTHSERDSLGRILADSAHLPVIEVEDKMAVTPGRVYLAPADYHLLIERNRHPSGPLLYFSLSVDVPVSYARPSIDALFESAAEACGSAVIGLILTGANADGSAGLRAVHAAGGLAVVQDPADAHCAVMPLSALRQVPSALTCRIDEAAGLLTAHSGLTL